MLKYLNSKILNIVLVIVAMVFITSSAFFITSFFKTDRGFIDCVIFAVYNFIFMISTLAFVVLAVCGGYTLIMGFIELITENNFKESMKIFAFAILCGAVSFAIAFGLSEFEKSDSQKFIDGIFEEVKFK